MPDKKPSSHKYQCAFCGKSQEHVHRLIAGPGGVYICNECVDLCREIIEEEQAHTPGAATLVARSPSPGETVSNPANNLLARDHPEIARACSNLYEAILGPGALDARTKQLVYIAVAGALGHASAVRAQIPAAVKAGATPAEIREALLAGIPAAGLPNVLSVYAEVADVLKPQER